MSLTEHRKATPEELAAGQVLFDPILFRKFFFKDDLTLELSCEQKLFMGDESEKVLLCTGRKLGKTVNLEAFVIQEGILCNNRGVTESLFFTPSDVHLTPFVDRVFGRLERQPLLKSLVRDKRRGDNTILEFASGMRWYFRIEGMSGKDTNMVVIRAKFIVGDECAYGNVLCHNARVQTALPGARWLYAGVPNGVRSSPFYSLDQTEFGKSWSRHKYNTFINPLYDSPESREQLAQDYQGVSTQGYVNNVLGDWGEELVSSFPPGSIAVRQVPYFTKQLIALTEEDMGRLPLLLGIPALRCKRFALGCDYGYSPDPSVLWAAYQHDDKDEWQCYFRIEMRRVALPHQAEIIRYVIMNIMIGEFLDFSCDNMGLVQQLQALASLMKVDPNRFLWSNPGGATPVEVEKIQNLEFELYRNLTEEQKKKKVANIPNKQFYTDLLKGWMINAVIPLEGRRLYLGEESMVVNELISTREKKTASGHIVYYGLPDPNIRGGMLDHNREGLIYLCHAIYVGSQESQAQDREDDLIEVMGWAQTSVETWVAPWGTNP